MNAATRYVNSAYSTPLNAIQNRPRVWPRDIHTVLVLYMAVMTVEKQMKMFT